MIKVIAEVIAWACIVITGTAVSVTIWRYTRKPGPLKLVDEISPDKLEEWATILHAWNHPEEGGSLAIAPGYVTRPSGEIEIKEISLVPADRALHPSWRITGVSEAPSRTRHRHGTGVWELPGIEPYHRYRAGAGHRKQG